MEKDLNQIRLANFKEALARVYSGCVFDIDGTLTVWGEPFIPAFAYEPLAKLAMNTPVAVCTARTLQQALEVISPVFGHSSDPKYCQSNWMFFCENGGIGYVYDSEKNKYVEFCRVQCPYPADQMENIFYRLKKILEGKVGQADLNLISFLFKPINRVNGTSAQIKESCHEITQIILKNLPLLDPKGVFRVADSGTGTNVFLNNGDKENGVREFVRYLKDMRGMNISMEAKEIVLIGDQPQPNGNDFNFLDGKSGTPFTAGETHPENVYPLPVFDLATEQVLIGPEATIYLINQLKFRT